MSTSLTDLLGTIQVSDLAIQLTLLFFIGVLFIVGGWKAKTVGLLYLVLASINLLGYPTWCVRGQVLTSHVVYEEAIYLLIDGPKFCILPWDEEKAEELQAMKSEGVPFYFDPTLEDDDDPVFHAMPQPGTPPKPEQPEARSFGI